jgi:flagellar motility protein MotE (MotC chaperone)
MKQGVRYLVLWIVTLILAVQVVLVLYYVKPEVFSVFNRQNADLPASSVKQNDSVIVAADTSRGAPRDSTASEIAAGVVAVTSSASESAPNVLVSSSRDSLKALSERLQAEIRKEASLEQKLATQNVSADSARTKELKGMAKMLESMSAEDAARILQNLKVTEAKKVLMAVKKKQAGKILSAMEPRIAARMMR